MKRILVLFLLSLSFMASQAQGPYTTAGGITLENFVSINCLRTVPNEYADSTSKKYGLIFYHSPNSGQGSTLDLIYNNAAAGGPAYHIAHSNWPDSFYVDGAERKYIVCSPQVGAGSGTLNATYINYVLKYMVANYRVDTTRIHIISPLESGTAVGNYLKGIGVTPRYKIASVVALSSNIGIYNYDNGTKIANDYTNWLGIADSTGSTNGDYTAKWMLAIKNNGGDSLTTFIETNQGAGNINGVTRPDTTFSAISGNIYEWMWKNRAYQLPSPPIASAGGDQQVLMPTNSITLHATVQLDPGASSATYAWTQLTGPNTPTLSGASTADLGVGLTGTHLVLGTYTFQVVITDNLGRSASSTMTLKVQNVPSTSEIPWNTRYIFDLNGRNGKGLRGLCDGNLLTKYDISGITEAVGGPIFTSRYVLPYKTSKMKIVHYDAFDGGSIGVKLYNNAKELIGTSTIVHGGGWDTLNISDVDSVRFIDFSYDDVAVGVYEMKIYGDSVAPAPKIFRDEVVAEIADPGIFAQGVCQLDNGYLAHLQDGTLIFPKTGKAGRSGFEGARFQTFPEGWTNELGPASYKRFGDDHIQTRLFDFADTWDIEMQFYSTGGTIRNIDSAYLAGLSSPSADNSYLADPWNNYKWIRPGADSLAFSSWRGKGHEVAHHAYRYGNKLGLPLNGLDFRINNANNLGNKSSGNRYGKRAMVYENGNENNRDWAGTRAWHSPQVWYRLQKVSYDSAKSRDPDFLVYMGANTFLDSTYAKAVYMEHYWLFGLDPFPADGLCYNMYQNEYLDGQGGGPSSKAVSPETFNFYERQVKFKDLLSTLFPNKAIRITETGVAYWDDSPYDVDAIGSRTDYQVAADVQLRIYAISQTVKLFERVFFYAGFPDGSVNFSSMTTTYGLYPRLWDSVTCMGYSLANQLAVETPYQWFSTTIAKGDTTGVWVTKKNHATDPNKKLFKVWRGSMTGTTTSNYSLNVGPNAISANRYSVRYNNFLPDTASAPITSNTITLDAKETMQWVEVTYSSTTPAPYGIRSVPGTRPVMRSQ